ncbi:MAG: hypothetical protein KF780_04470 [Sphingomonas sp.]|nr:hypothetical protein [Sphingomonas sp.]
MALRWLLLGLATLLLVPAGAIAAEISLSPRFVVYFDNGEQRQQGIGAFPIPADALAELSDQIRALAGPDAALSGAVGEGGGSARQIVFPMFGGAISVGGQRTQFTFTALYGEAESRSRIVVPLTLSLDAGGFTATDLLTSVSEGNASYRRLDLELTAQHRLDERFALIGGVRYERVRGGATLDSASTSSNNIANLTALLSGAGPVDLGLSQGAERLDLRSGSETWSLRAGAAAFVPFARRQLAYVNGMIHASHTPPRRGAAVLTDLAGGGALDLSADLAAETATGPDISVGILTRLGDRLALDVRYRGIFYFPLSGVRSFSDPRVNHGLNLGLTVALGR